MYEVTHCRGNHCRLAPPLLYAAEHPIRDIYVGGAGRALSVASFLTPRMTESAMERCSPRNRKIIRVRVHTQDSISPRVCCSSAVDIRATSPKAVSTLGVRYIRSLSEDCLPRASGWLTQRREGFVAMERKGMRIKILRSLRPSCPRVLQLLS